MIDTNRSEYESDVLNHFSQLDDYEQRIYEYTTELMDGVVNELVFGDDEQKKIEILERIAIETEERIIHDHQQTYDDYTREVA